MIRALDAAGALAGVCYASRTLGWKQLGTAPTAGDARFLTSRKEKTQAFTAAISRSDDAHLMVSFANRLCFEAMARCASAGRPYFVLAESFTPRGHSPRGLVRDFVYRYLLRRVTATFALAPTCALDFRRVGVPASRIFPGAYPGPEVLEAYRTGDTRRVVFCGRLIPIKGIDVLVTALRALAEAGRPLALDVIGEGPTASELRRLEGSGVHLVAHGSVSTARVRELLRGARALVLPTRFWEGWGYVVNEALAAGIPVVASDIVAARELIVDGRTGAVFRSEDASSLARALERALALHSDSDGLAASIAVAQEGLDARTFARYMLDVMASTIEGATPSADPPWHLSAARLGGNPELRWWKEFRGHP